jgi:hypothetical protein
MLKKYRKIAFIGFDKRGNISIDKYLWISIKILSSGVLGFLDEGQKKKMF